MADVDTYTLQGSSAIQTVAALQPKVKHMTNYVRGKTWLATPSAGTSVPALLGREPTLEDEEGNRESLESSGNLNVNADGCHQQHLPQRR